ncbi:hypothetical protein DSL72_009100 [Monilinia vaccinii-corymbosi]|uniref:Uncharacterized protein n=1 Tax=Monilinia vaccinii-corymbosi TaxID=61207 RepID=A0A8A3PNL6_9HELO|nr:hypothetical protein DSL72_009100 [Monilinia vaccinii-corymbosi]
MSHQGPRGLPPQHPLHGGIGRGATGPPPQPPPPRGAGPPDGLPPFSGAGRGGPPPQMQVPMPMPRRYESSHIVDLNATGKPPLNEAACRKLLTTYRVYSIQKVQPTGKEKSTWAKAVVTQEPLTQEDIAAQLKKLNESPKTISDKKGALFYNQQRQVNKLLDGLKNEEGNTDFDWSLAQLGRRERTSNSGCKKVRETVLITVIVKHAVRDNLNAMLIYQIIEKIKQENAAEIMRPPAMPPQPPQVQPPPNPTNPPAPAPVTKAVHVHGNNDRPPHYQSDSNSDTGSDSDTVSTSASTISSSLGTSVSSRSDERPRRHHPREHRKKYYTHRSKSPEPIFQEFRRSSHSNPHYVGEATPIAASDAIAQAIQQGREEERATVQRYLSQSKRPIIIDEPSRAVIPADRRESGYNTALPRYPLRQYAEVPIWEVPRYTESQHSRSAPRYRDRLYNDRRLNDLYEDDAPPVVTRDVRSVTRDAAYRRRLSDAESYLSRDAIAAGIRYIGPRPQIAQVHSHHSFTNRSPSRCQYGFSYRSDSTHT